MLATNLSLFKTQLNQLLNPTKGSVMFDAAYNAYYNTIKVDIDSNNDDPDLKPIIDAEKAKCEQKMKDDAKKFAEEFCKGLKNGGFMDSIADQVDMHIKSAQIDIIVPTLLPTIISPVGPCTGSLAISQNTGAQIIIS